MDDSTDSAIAAKLRELRAEQGLTIEALATASGVSRAMISKIERGEASPTAALLARLCSALGFSLSTFFADQTTAPSPLLPRREQPVWRDPETGYIRRSVSPAGSPSRVDIVEVDFPSGARVSFPPQPQRGELQHVWLFEGELEMTVGESTHRLSPGDCLFMPLGRGHIFYNPGKTPARYAVIFERQSLPYAKELP